jgi:hypothetical protein
MIIDLISLASNAVQQNSSETLKMETFYHAIKLTNVAVLKHIAIKGNWDKSVAISQ